MFTDDVPNELSDYEDFDYVELQFVTVQLLGHVIVEHGDDVAVANVEMYAAKMRYLNGDEIVEVIVVDVDEEFGYVDVKHEIGVVAAVVIAAGETQNEVEQKCSDEKHQVGVEIDVGIAELVQVVEDVSCNQKLVERLPQTFL